ncbi:MAG: type IV toxin-antitoxin system AbiEi family antitoxin domain-containing protein [Solirubrobacterales bacterium]
MRDIAQVSQAPHSPSPAGGEFGSLDAYGPMTTKSVHPWAEAAWRLTRRQHGVVTRKQLVELGMSPRTIRARLETGRLHRLWPGIYAVGRPDIDRLGRLKAATLACGPDARLSHRSAAELWRIGPKVSGPIDVSVPSGTRPRRPGIASTAKSSPGRRGQSRASRSAIRSRSSSTSRRAYRTMRSKTPSTRPTGSTSSARTGSAPPWTTSSAALASVG